jgi:hypothetical protein
VIPRLLSLLPLLLTAFALLRCIRQPAWVLVAIVSAVCFPVTLATAVTVHKIVLLASFVRVLALIARRRVLLPVSPLVPVFIGVELLFTLATLSWREGSFYSINWIVGATLCYVVVSQAVETVDELRDIGPGMLAVLLLTVLVTTVQYRDASRSALIVVRAAGPIGDPNATGAFAVVTAFFAAPWVLARPARSRLVWLGVLLVPLIGLVFMTNSRGVTVGLIGSIAAAMWLLSRGPAQRIRNIAIGITILIGAWALAPASYETRMTETLRSDVSGQLVVNDTGRSQLNRIGLEMIAEEPVLGHGPRAFPVRARRIVGYAYALHNAWLGAIVEVGVPIGLLYLATHLLPLWWMWRAAALMPGPDRSVVAAVVGASAVLLLFYASNPSRFEPMDYLTIGLAAKVAALANRRRAPVPEASASLVGGGLAVDGRPA